MENHPFSCINTVLLLYNVFRGISTAAAKNKRKKFCFFEEMDKLLFKNPHEYRAF